MIKGIEWDESYPVFFLYEPVDSASVKADFTEAELEWIAKAEAEYDRMQAFLKAKVHGEPAEMPS